MKKRILSVFLILALALMSLAGCASGGGSPAETPNEDRKEDEQLLATGYYEVYDEDDELVGFIRVMSSKIIVYDEYGSEGATLPYDYSGRKETYTIEDGELFGCEKFTVEKSKKKLILITEDKDEYTLEEISKSDIPTPTSRPVNSESPDPSPSEAASMSPGPGPATPTPAPTPYVELPLGCYAVYGNKNFGYLKVTAGTMILYNTDGSVDAEDRYSYNPDGSCVIIEGSEAFTVLFTYEQGSYYMTERSNHYRLEQISESQIPVYGGGSSLSTSYYYIGGNGVLYLCATLPDTLYDDLYFDSDDDGSFFTMGNCSGRGSAWELSLEMYLFSGDALQSILEEVLQSSSGTYGAADALLFDYLQDTVLSLYDSPDDINEGYLPLNGLYWRYLEVYSEDEYTHVVLLFWMEGDSMAAVIAGGSGESYGDFDEMSNTLADIVYSLELYY